MIFRLYKCSLAATIFILAASALHADEKPLPEGWDYAGPMTKVAAKFNGRPGVVIHIGDSITYANPYSQWARAGQGKTAADKAVLEWMHAGKDDESDGWWLARFDHPDGGRSYTAAGGLRTDESLAGGRQGLPPLAKILDAYRPQIVVYMLGTNDVSADKSLDAYKANIEKSLDLMVDRGIIPIVSTIPPHPKQLAKSRAFNEALREICKRRGLPLIDFEREILRRRPDDWNGTLLGKDDVHPTAEQAGVTAASAPTAENLRNCGYLLRGWLSVQKIAEVKRTVIDRMPERAPDLPAADHPPKSHADDFGKREPIVLPVPRGDPIRFAVTRDTWFSNVGSEANGNNGGAGQLKLKSYQEMSLVDFYAVPLTWRVVTGAYLHLHLATPNDPLRRVTVSSFAAPWVEGTATGYAPQKGSSTFNARQSPDVPWSFPGSDLTSVTLGAGGTIWRMADATPPDAEGWQKVPVDPDVIAARIAGLSEGFLVFDDTGSEWTRDGEKFIAHPFPNRFVHSRESGPKTAPYFTVYLKDGEDHDPPEAPAHLTVDAKRTSQLPSGEAWLTWETPADQGFAGTLGFSVTVDGHTVPRYLIPLAGPVGQTVEMHLRDMNIEPGRVVAVEVSAVDRAGNTGPAKRLLAQVSGSGNPAGVTNSGASEEKTDESLIEPVLGESRISIIDELEKPEAVSGKLVPTRPGGGSSNNVWHGGRVTLSAARNEFVAFQILFRGAVSDVTPRLEFPRGKEDTEPTASFGQLKFVAAKKGRIADPVVPIKGSFSVPAAGAKPGEETCGCLYCEIYVPHNAAPGNQEATLFLRTQRETVRIPVRLHVWDFTLPDQLSFLPEMNCYGLPGPEREYYELAHEHRTVLNVVPYHQNGVPEEGWAPRWDGKQFDWTAWDHRFGPLFDGTAFADSPRRVPQECFYLPLNENWPSPMEGNYNGDYWADRAFPASYRQAFVEASRQMAEHLNARGWNDTLFQCFFNGKNNFKANGWSRGSSPWLLDEPAHFQDFWALRYFATAFHEGVNQAPGQAKLLFRADISRPEWQRDSLDGLLDYNVVSGAMRKYERAVIDRKQAQGQILLEYGNSNAIEDSNVQPVGWSIDAWCRGCDGVLPWLAIGTDEAWNHAEQTALIYPRRPGDLWPVPSLRLKAYRRGQQDVEYLTLYSQLVNQPRWMVAKLVRGALHAKPNDSGTEKTSDDDAGIVRFDQLRPEDLHSLRVLLATLIDEQHPPARRQLIDFRTPPRDISHLPPRVVGE